MDVWEVLLQQCEYIVNKWEGGREGILLLNLFIIRDIRSGYDEVYVPTYIAVYCVQQNIRIYIYIYVNAYIHTRTTSGQTYDTVTRFACGLADDPDCHFLSSACTSSSSILPHVCSLTKHTHTRVQVHFSRLTRRGFPTNSLLTCRVLKQNTIITYDSFQTHTSFRRIIKRPFFFVTNVPHVDI